jgi:pimeloyl-ACP methyl ester carboxylesterase
VERFVSFDGVAVAYRKWPGTVAAPPVLLLHDLGLDHALAWVGPGVVGALTNAGRTVVGMDFRGHGKSDKPHEPERNGEVTLAHDVIELIDVLKVDSVDVVGLSMGAVVALIAATRDPRISRLIVGGVGASVVELGGMDTRVVNPRVFSEALRSTDPTTITDPDALGFRQLADAVDADREALAVQLDVAHHDHIPLRRISARTLVLAGREDTMAARPEVLVHAIPRAVGRTILGDHVASVGNPEFSHHIVEFLRR